MDVNELSLIRRTIRDQGSRNTKFMVVVESIEIILCEISQVRIFFWFFYRYVFYLRPIIDSWVSSFYSFKLSMFIFDTRIIFAYHFRIHRPFFCVFIFFFFFLPFCFFLDQRFYTLQTRKVTGTTGSNEGYPNRSFASKN